MVGRDAPEPIRLGRLRNSSCHFCAVRLRSSNQESPGFSHGECQSQDRCLLRDTDPYLPPKAAWRSKEDSNLQPLAEHSLSKRADCHYHIAAFLTRHNHFHTLSSTATAQKTGRTGKRVADVFCAVRVGVEPTRQLSLSACFRDRIAQPLAILTMWRSEQDSNLQAAFAVRPISTRGPYHLGSSLHL